MRDPSIRVYRFVRAGGYCGFVSVDNAINAVEGRRPGQYCREYLRPRAWLAITVIVLLGVGTPGLGFPLGWHNHVFLVAEVAEILSLVATYRFTCARLDPWVRGKAGEDFVGAVLEGLSHVGWRALHGLQTGRTDIDHIAIGPGGILTIETKSRQGLVPAGAMRRMIRQASSHRRRLLELVPTLGEADALLVIRSPHAGGSISRKRGVIVVYADGLARHLRMRPTIMSDEQVQLAYDEIVRAAANE